MKRCVCLDHSLLEDRGSLYLARSVCYGGVDLICKHD